MGELTGGLIQMNAKMVVTQYANTLIIYGMIAAMVGVVLTIIAAFERVTDKKASKRKLRRVLFCVVFMLAGIIVLIVGMKQPRVKEIHACASGPLSLETVETKYDIVSIDGKELVLRER